MPTTIAVPESKSEVRHTTSLAPFRTEPGRPHPLGATVDKDGVNFSVFSRNATTVEAADQVAVEGLQVRVEGRSVLVLLSR